MFYQINNIYNDLLDTNINIQTISENLLPKTKDTIIRFSNRQERKNIRKNMLVDQYWANEYIEYYNKNPIITHYDCIGENVINMPLGIMPSKYISHNIDYYKSYHPIEPQYKNKVFWRGRGFTHNIRKILIDFLKDKKHPNVDVDYWTPDGNPYGPIKPPPSEYTKYFEQLKSSDIFLVIRGDLPWLNSFFDALRAGCIPVCIDTFYGNLGWENIGIEKEDILVDFHTSINSLDEIYEKIIKLVLNKDKILYMKDNIRNFYNKYILTDRYLNKYHTAFHFSGWGDFLVAKILDLVENNYQITNKQFFCAKVKEIKNI